MEIIQALSRKRLASYLALEQIIHKFLFNSPLTIRFNASLRNAVRVLKMRERSLSTEQTTHLTQPKPLLLVHSTC